ncbi:MAG: hypothetical protein AAF558_11945 [Verrucomicrobiota bacterium]
MITRKNIVGSKIRKIHSVEFIDGGGEDIYFTTDREITFRMPWPGIPWENESLPKNAKPLSKWRHSTVRNICRRSILGVMCEYNGDDPDFYCSDHVHFSLTDKSLISVSSCAPKGLPSGVYWVKKDENRSNSGHDFFDLQKILIKRNT